MRERLQGFITRIGGMLVAPRRTLGGLLSGGRGGLGDMLLLLGLQLLVVQLPRLTAAALYLVQVSYSGGLSALLNTISQAVVVQLAAVLIATVVFGLASRGRPGRGRALDCVSLALVPSICLQLVVSLAVALLPLPPARSLALALLIAGGLWFAALCGLGVILARQASSELSEAPAHSQRRAFRAGLGVMVILFGLLLFSLVQVVRGWDQLQPAARGTQAPAFSLNTLAGERRELSELRGKVVLLDFWATWCRPCVKELPLLVELQQQLGPRGLKILAINVEDDPENLAAFVRERKLGDALTVLKGTPEVTRRYGVSTLPHLVLVGPDGQIMDVRIGPVPDQQLRKWLSGAVAAAEGARR